MRLFATDLDGTLLLPDGTLGQRTREAIDALIERGIVVVFVTGRPPRWIRPIAEMTGHHGTAIGVNGALVIDMEAEIIRRVHAIDPVSARTTADRLRAVTPDITFAVEYAQEGLGLEGSSFALSTGYIPRWEVPRGTEILEPDVLFARPGITKL
ncbi:MAG: HAD-IIB family hydrolase [Actinomycetes bacterium]